MINKESRNRNFAAILSLIIGTSLMLLKFWAYNMTKSHAIFSDAMESIVNVVAASLAIFVIYYAAKPRDQDHPYGHGKAEYFSAAFEGGLIAFAAVMIIVEASQSLLGGYRLHNLGDGLKIVVIAGIINLLLGLYLIMVGKKNSSLALVASGKHVISDFVTSAGILVGLAIVYFTGMMWLDAASAIIVAVWLAYTGLKLVRESIGGLMDEEDLDVLTQLKTVFEKNLHRGIIQIHHVKVIRSGNFHHIDAHVVMPEFWDVKKVHDEIEQFEVEFLEDYDKDGEANFHVDPCRRVYCRHCELKNCPIRKEEFSERMPIKIEHMRSLDEPEEFDPPY